MGLKTGECFVCKKPSSTRCSACGLIYYCSVDHQKEDWKSHKKSCYSFKICTNDEFGRYLVANRDIKEGEIVIKEKPILRGPSQITKPVCVGCLEGLEEQKHLECERCGWPICSRECQNISDHLFECEFTIKRGSKVSIQHFVSPHPTYQCLSTLRALLLKEKSPEKWKFLTQLESHSDTRYGTEQWRSDRAGIAQFIPRFFKCENKWSENEILNITGILQINGHEVPITDPPYVAVYNNASMFEHSCLPNITKSFGKNGEIIFWAPKPINKGEHLSISYTDVLWGTPNRLHHLHQTKMFTCNCKRCVDPTELKTYFSALNCDKEENNKLCNGFVISENFLEKERSWKCSKCSKEFDFTYVKNILDRATKDYDCMDKASIEHCIKYIQHYCKWLAPNNFRLCQVKLILAQLLGSGGTVAIQKIKKADLDKKIKLCQDLLKLFYIIAPSEARLLGTLRFELHSALAEIGRRDSNERNPNFKSALEESLYNAEESIRFLKYEPIVLPEGQIGQQAKSNAHSLKVILGIPTNV